MSVPPTVLAAEFVRPEETPAARLLADLHNAGALRPGMRLTEPSLLHGVHATDVFPAREEVERKLARGLLRWPYLGVLQHGVTPELWEYTHTRDVIGHRRDGFADHLKIRALMDRGASVKLNALSHWHRGTRALVQAIERVHPYAVSSYAFWTPPGETGMLPHRDPGLVLAVQLEGSKRWTIYDEPPEVKTTPGIDVDTTVVREEFVTVPGDVVVLPHGWAHVVDALDEPSFHVTFTLTGPSTADLVEGLRERRRRVAVRWSSWSCLWPSSPPAQQSRL